MHRPQSSFFSTITASIIRALVMLQRRQNVPSFHGGRSATKRNYDTNSSRYMPHQGKAEMARRVRQLEGRA
ncbi:hypothetical protein UFOVP143_35 [uncultured Caudovirales phage]|uniref:Uncharacterized protein n=1 Tax=uncultured Caudovirales phage TaxID=2100421 RepID=A0A6J7VLY2_9CAUD|nr:hypothetical protein UFOVP143_35 [uncultured Caudovirales phage]